MSSAWLLLRAIDGGAEAAVCTLLNEGADPWAACLQPAPALPDDAEGAATDTPLCRAARRGSAKIVALLLKLLPLRPGKHDVDDTKAGGVTPLYLACRHGHHAAACTLLAAGARPDQAAEDGSTPLLVACQYGTAWGPASNCAGDRFFARECDPAAP